ncbi:unnamed protein product [[Candida] boidinii]|nr:unnamed protein product [[Candida] boidinii]
MTLEATMGDFFIEGVLSVVVVIESAVVGVSGVTVCESSSEALAIPDLSVKFSIADLASDSFSYCGVVDSCFPSIGDFTSVSWVSATVGSATAADSGPASNVSCSPSFSFSSSASPSASKNSSSLLSDSSMNLMISSSGV